MCLFWGGCHHPNPSLNCRHCVRYCRSGYRDEPENHQIVMFIDPCSAHSTPVIRPLRPDLLSSAPRNPNPPRSSPPQPATVPNLPPAPTASSTPPAPSTDPAPPVADRDPAPPAADPVPPAADPAADPTPPSDPAAPPPADSAPPSDPAPPAYSPPPDPAPPPYTPADPATNPAPPAYSAPNRPPARTFSLTRLINEYDRVVTKVNQQMTLYTALESEGLSPSFFFRKRCVAEAAKVDSGYFRCCTTTQRQILILV